MPLFLLRSAKKKEPLEKNCNFETCKPANCKQEAAKFLAPDTKKSFNALESEKLRPTPYLFGLDVRIDRFNVVYYTAHKNIFYRKF